MHVPFASKDTEIADIWNLTSFPGLNWSLPLKCTRWGAIVCLTSCTHSIFPNDITYAPSIYNGHDLLRKIVLRSLLQGKDRHWNWWASSRYRGSLRLSRRA